jgi:hypothetical protein
MEDFMKNLPEEIARAVTQAILKLSEELVDHVLFGKIEKAPLSLVSDKVDLSKLRRLDTEAYLRVCLAAAIRQKFGGPHATRPPHHARRSRFSGARR